MVVTYVNLVGAWEHFDKTLASRLTANWNPANTGGITPKVYSASGLNVSHSWARTFGTNEIHLNEDETSLQLPLEEANGNTRIGMKTLVYIDVFSNDANKLKLFMLEINRIIWELNPNSSNRIKKSNGTENSPISHFDRYTVYFRKEREIDPSMKIYAHASGTLGVIWYKVRT